MNAATRCLIVLRELADDDGIVPSIKRASLAAQVGTSISGTSAVLWELMHFGSIEKIDKLAVAGETGRFRITGKPPGRDGSGSNPFIDDAAIARRLKETYGIEIATRRARSFAPTTSSAGGEHVAVSVARVRFLEGVGP